MWSIEFELADIATTFGIISSVSWVFYRFGIKPILTSIEMSRVSDSLRQKENYEQLREALFELREEIRQSRKDRLKHELKQVELSGQLEVLGAKITDLKTEMHQHITLFHQGGGPN